MEGDRIRQEIAAWLKNVSDPNHDDLDLASQPESKASPQVDIQRSVRSSALTEVDIQDPKSLKVRVTQLISVSHCLRLIDFQFK